MRENRTCGSEGGEAQSLPYPYPAPAECKSALRRSQASLLKVECSRAQGRLLWCFGYLLFEEDEVFFFEAAEEGL